jgi:hypothetical protein
MTAYPAKIGSNAKTNKGYDAYLYRVRHLIFIYCVLSLKSICTQLHSSFFPEVGCRFEAGKDLDRPNGRGSGGASGGGFAGGYPFTQFFQLGGGW